MPSRYILCHFNLTVFPLYPVKLKKGTKQPTVRSGEPIVPNFRRKLFNVRFFLLVRISLVVFCQKIFYMLMSFDKNLYSNSIWLILTCKLKLNCRDMRRVTVTSTHKYVNYMRLWNIYSCFHWCENYKNRPANARVILENKVAPLFPDTVYTGWANKSCIVLQSSLCDHSRLCFTVFTLTHIQTFTTLVYYTLLFSLSFFS